MKGDEQMVYEKEKGNNQKKDSIGNSNKKNLLRSLVLLSLLIPLIITTEKMTIIFPHQRIIEGRSVCSQNEVIFETKGKYLEEEKVISWIQGEAFSTTTVTVKGKIQLNFTVLPCSNASVFFDCAYGCMRNFNWTPPVPDNFSLAPGESFAEIYTLERGVSQIGGFTFEAYVFTEGANATVRWWYKVLKKGRNVALLFALRTGWWLILLVGVPIGVLVGVGTIGIILYVRDKKKKNESSLSNAN